MSGISVRGLTFGYGPVPLFDDLHLELDSGTFTVVVGPNGAGKSTLLALIAGILKPAHGEIRLGDRSMAAISQSEMARIRSYLPNTSNHELPYTVDEIVHMGTYPWAEDRHDSHASVDRALSILEIDDLADRPVSTISSGEVRRTEIARTLTQSTPIVLLDEPLSSLDLRHCELVLSMLKNKARSGGTVVAVVHDLNASARYADQIVLVDRGRVHAGIPEDVLTSRRLSSSYRMPIRVSRDGDSIRVIPGEASS